MSAENGRKFCLPRRITCRVCGDTMPVTTSPAAGKEASVLVKGVSRRVIVVESPDPRIFEQAIFILPTDGGGVKFEGKVFDAVVEWFGSDATLFLQNALHAAAQETA